MIGGTVTYDQHLTEHALARKQAHLSSLKIKITLLGLAFVTLFMTTLCCQGIVKAFSDSIVVTTGCNIGIGLWYLLLTAITFLKFLITCVRNFLFIRNNEESVVMHLGGNFILMPILFFTFFVYTQVLNNTYTGVADAQDIESAYLNVCQLSTSDILSQTLYYAFRVISCLSFLVVFYYLVTTCMLFQSICLI